jgi:type VI secretion system protein ImpE
MTPQELYRNGRLREAITALGEELRKNPLDAKRRTFLFELLLFAGEYDRAEKQLEVLSGAGADAAAGTLLYRSALYAERTRQDMFSRNQTPALAARDQAAGVCDGLPFHDFQDSDPRIGANLEVYMAGSYTWIPVAYLRKVEIEPPSNLRDLMWARARVETTPEFRLQELGEVLIPALCPLSSGHTDENVRLGRETAWEEDPTHEAVPFGAKVMLVDGADIPLLSIRRVEWLPTLKESPDAPAR